MPKNPQPDYISSTSIHMFVIYPSVMTHKPSFPNPNPINPKIQSQYACRNERDIKSSIYRSQGRSDGDYVVWLVK